MKIVVHGPRRHLPTSVPYRTDPLSAFTVEAEVRDCEDLYEWLEQNLDKIRGAQADDLDAQEDAFVAKYAVPAPRPADTAEKAAAADARKVGGLVALSPPAPSTIAEARRLLLDYERLAGKPFPPRHARDSPYAMPATEQAAAQLVRDLADALQGLKDAQASPESRSTPPPDAMRDVSDGSADELRRLGAQLAALGHPYEEAAPASEAAAQHLIQELRAKLHGLEAAKAAPPTLPASPRAAWTPGANVAVAQRRCGHPAHTERHPAFISAAEWDYSQREYGKPLCRDHQRGAPRLNDRK